VGVAPRLDRGESLRSRCLRGKNGGVGHCGLVPTEVKRLTTGRTACVPMFTVRSLLVGGRRIGILAGAVGVGLLFGGCTAVPTPLSRVDLLHGRHRCLLWFQEGDRVGRGGAGGGEGRRVFRRLSAAGRSMEPLYAARTAIVVREQSFRTLRPGMAVVYRNRANRYVAHLLVEELAGGWVASGLSNPTSDDELVTHANFVGIVQAAFAADDTMLRARIAAGGSSKVGGDRGPLLAAGRD